MDEACADPLVITCTTAEGSIVVTVPGDASDGAVIEYASRLYEAASSAPATVTLQAAPTDDASTGDPEIAPRPRWEVAVQTKTAAEFETALAALLAASAVPGTTGITVIDGWPYVTVEQLDQFDDAFAALSSTPLFRNGGTYSLQSVADRLRIVHVPARTADVAIHEIIGIATDYPDAEVLLEAPTAGVQYPKLYVSRLTPAEVQELDVRLREPRLADADVDGFALGYVLGSLGEEGTTYVEGSFGGVPG